MNHVIESREWNEWQRRKRSALDKRGDARYKKYKARTLLIQAINNKDLEKISEAKSRLFITEEIVKEKEHDYLCIKAMEPNEVPLKKMKRTNIVPCECGTTRVCGPKWVNKNCRYWITHPECKPDTCIRPTSRWIIRGEQVSLWLTRHSIFKGDDKPAIEGLVDIRQRQELLLRAYIRDLNDTLRRRRGVTHYRKRKNKKKGK
jgi:hypothetical protein